MKKITTTNNSFPAKEWNNSPRANAPLYRFQHYPALIPLQQDLKGNKIMTENSYNSKVDELIGQSRYILTLEEGWDEGDALPIDKTIWENATSFLRAYVTYISQQYGMGIELPEINPLRDGSIDLEWRTSRARLLINFNNRNPQKASFYGDRYANVDRIKGNIDVKEVEAHLAIWMKNCL